MAEGLFRKAVEGRGDYSVGSAGVSARSGARCSMETAMLCEAAGASLDGFRSREVTKGLLSDATHVFAMTRGHLGILEEDFPEFSDKYYLTGEFADVEGDGLGADVPDPIGMGPGAYRDVEKVLGVAIPAIIAYIDQTMPKVEE